MSRYRYAALFHTRWFDTEEPRATVIRSLDGEYWYEVCNASAEEAQAIVWAMNAFGGTNE